MHDDLLELLRCPISKSRLHWQDSATLVAEEGGRTYSLKHGIIDFRLFDPPYKTREEEARLVERLAAAAATGKDLVGLIRYYEAELSGGLSESGIQHQIEHRLALHQRAPERLRTMVAQAGIDGLSRESVVLDLGCGSGEALSTLLGLGAARVIGIDISLIELFFARQFLAEQGIEALLVAGCAEALPFADAAFSFIYSPDVIEHVTDQKTYLEEAYRTLAPGGRLLLNSPNRYSLVCPEPHVGIWGLGFLPRRLMDPCCQLLGKGSYVGKRLISLRELRKPMAHSFDSYVIKSRESNPDATSLVGKLFHSLSPISVKLFAHVCDQHVILASKQV